MNEQEGAASAALQERMIDLPGLRMHVVEAGAGEPVLLLHGFPQSSREWAPVIMDLATDHRAIAPDLRGAGQTDAPAAGYDAPTVASDVIALLDALGLDRVALVAHDWSALVGFGMAAVALPLSVGISVLEAVVVVPVQAFVFTLLTAVFIGMAIHAHH